MLNKKAGKKMEKEGPQVLQCIEFQESVIQVLKNNTVLFTFRNKCSVGVQLLKKVMEAAAGMSRNKRYRVIIVTEPGVVFTREGLHYSISKEYLQNNIALAAIIDSKFRVFTNNLWQSLKTTDVPFKLFTSVDEAVTWLETV